MHLIARKLENPRDLTFGLTEQVKNKDLITVATVERLLANWYHFDIGVHVRQKVWRKLSASFLRRKSSYQKL